MMPKRENEQAANRRLTRYIILGFIISSRNAHSACSCRCNLQVNVWFIRMYERRPVSKLPEHTHNP